MSWVSSEQHSKNCGWKVDFRIFDLRGKT